MLSIGLVGSAQETYYTERLGAEDYYHGGGEPEGEWAGGGAKQLGLTGTVEKEIFSRLFQGLSPDGERQLRRNIRTETKQSRAAFDLTFNAPKSVSVLFSQVDDDLRRVIQEAQAAAVRAALEYVERVAGQIRLGRNGAQVEEAMLTTALFEHSTARLVEGQTVPDPHLHTHAVVLNFGITEEGKFATLHSREIFRTKMSAGVLYRAELFAQLEKRLGLVARRGEKFCELEGVPAELIGLFSKRRKVIEAESERRGVTEYGKGTSDAALHTRTTKPKVDREKFIEEWQRIGREHGYDVEAEIATALRSVPERDVPTLVDEATRKAVERVTEQQAHFSERELTRALGDLLEDQGVGAAAIVAGVDTALHSPEVVAVGDVRGEKRFTTREMLVLERRMLRQAADLSRRAHRVSQPMVEGVLESRPTITGEQRDALLHVTQGRALSLVRGVAGTGKTYLLDAAREAWEAAGYEVRGAALAGKAARGLEDGAAIESSTIHKLLFELRDGRTQLTPQTVLVIDEAGMVGTRQMEELVRRVEEARAKLVLVGDDRQLQAIDAGAPFASLARKHGAAELEEIRRQREEWARRAVHEFSRGEARAALERFVSRGLLRVEEFKVDAVRALADDLIPAASECGYEEVVALTGTRADARRLNREVQLRRQLLGELGPERIEIDGEEFYVGDRVLFRKNSRLRGVVNGDRGEVVAVTRDTFTVRLDSGHRVTVHETEAESVQPHLGYASTTHAAQGATVDRAFVLVGGSMQDREATYVQASRARVETCLYTDSLTVGEGEESSNLARTMERSRRKDLATDHLGQESSLGQEWGVP